MSRATLYELAKQLKEAGFRQSGTGYLQGEFDISNPSTTYYIPSLAELIEACEEFVTGTSGQISIQIYPHSKGNGFEGEDLNVTRHVYVHALGWRYQGEGSTPEEAVANLWLELNKNANN